MKRWIGAAAVALAVIAAAPSVPAQPQGGGSIEITPAKVERDQSSAAVLVDYTIFNNDTTAPHVVDLTLSGLTHDLDGGPLFDSPIPAGSSLRANTGRMTLAPGERRAVRVTGRIPKGTGGLYAGVVLEVDPVDPAPGGVQVRRRVAGEILVRGPRPWIETHAVEAVELQRRGSAAELVAVVRNTGDVHQRPSGTVTVFRGSKRVGSAAMENQLVLPSSARRLRAEWDGPADAVGDRDLTFEATFGGETRRFGPDGRVLAPGQTVPTTAPPPKIGDDGGDLGAARGLGAALLALVIGLLLWAWRRRRRRRDDP